MEKYNDNEVKIEQAEASTENLLKVYRELYGEHQKELIAERTKAVQSGIKPAVKRTTERVAKTFNVIVTEEFPADFMPPEYYDTADYGKCYPCPFEYKSEEGLYDCCDFPGVIVGDEDEERIVDHKIKCPIKKYF